MRASYSVAIAIGCFVLGGAVVQTLHAQAKPPAFVLSEVTVKDEEAYKQEFLPLARKSIGDHGGKYIAGGFNKTVSFDGSEPANRVVLFQFDNMDTAKAWYGVAKADIQKVGSKYATFRTFAIEGMAQ
jgi:uncharacterized protein (DUF1330 family)